MKNREEITRRLQSSLKEVEKSQQDNKASALKYDTKSLTLAEKFLNALSRLCTYDETCTAILHDGKKLLIASNRQYPSYAQKFITELCKFLKSPFKSEYEKLYDLILKDIELKIKEFYYGHGKGSGSCSAKFSSSYDNAQNATDQEVLNLLNEIEKFYTSQASQDISVIVKSSKELVNAGVVSEYAKPLASDLIRPIADLNFIVNTIFSGDQNVLNIVQSIITIDDDDGYRENPYQCHAEMVILQEIYSTNIKSFVATTKLTCCACCISIDITNQKAENESKKFKAILNHSGTHGAAYSTWVCPDIIIENEGLYEELEKELLSTLPAEYYKEKELYPYEYSYAEDGDRKWYVPDAHIITLCQDYNELLNEISEKNSKYKQIQDKLDDTKKEILQNTHNLREIKENISSQNKDQIIFTKIKDCKSKITELTSKNEELSIQKELVGALINWDKEIAKKVIDDNSNLDLNNFYVGKSSKVSQILNKPQLISRYSRDLQEKQKSLESQITINNSKIQEKQEDLLGLSEETNITNDKPHQLTENEDQGKFDELKNSIKQLENKQNILIYEQRSLFREIEQLEKIIKEINLYLKSIQNFILQGSAEPIDDYINDYDSDYTDQGSIGFDNKNTEVNITGNNEITENASYDSL